jgi:hypothetical protein
MHGLGDNIYQRAYVKALSEQIGNVWLSTPWPQLYADLDKVHCMRTGTKLRTQAKNEKIADGWNVAPFPRSPPRRVFYSPRDMFDGMSIFEAMGGVFPGLRPAELSLPAILTTAPWGPRPTSRPLAIIRPPTVRREWRNDSRNCDPSALAQISRFLMRTHHVMSVADLQDGEEWLVGPPPPAHVHRHRGEIRMMELLDLCRDAAVLVGPPGWLAPFGIASRTPTFIVLGGQGGHNGPDKLQPEWLGPGRLGYATPDRFCQCGDNRHSCDKRISNPLAQFSRWAKAAGVIG